MPRRIHLHPYLTAHELHERYRHAHHPVERSRWQFLWLLARGLTATAIARVTGYSPYWIGQIARRYNTAGPDGVRDQRRHVRAHQPLLTEEQQATLRRALAKPHPAGDQWCGRTAATWMSAQLGQRVSRQTAWRALRRLGACFLKPRPRHIQADPGAQASFKARLRPLLREVATAFPHASVELWAVDEHRIGLKPILHKVWCVDGQRPLAPVQHRYEWRYLVGFVHPASGHTVFHLATSVSIPLFEVELEAFARRVGAGPDKQIVLMLDRAGWHTSMRLRVPDHLHLLFLPAYSPELNPAEHLWPLTNTALVNRHFATIEALEDPRRSAVSPCKVAAISSAPPRVSIGGPSGLRNHKDRGVPGSTTLVRRHLYHGRSVGASDRTPGPVPSVVTLGFCRTPVVTSASYEDVLFPSSALVTRAS